jgi:hypothetical protein
MTDEEKKFRCEKCQRDFASEEALGHHNSAKHSETKKKEEAVRKPASGKKARNWIFLILVLGLITAGVVWGVSGTVKEDEYCQNQPVTDMNIGGHTNLKNHIHQEFEIIIDGVEQEIPADIGISPGIMRPIHTHDASGEIHVEGPCVRDFTLGEFFDLWGREFNSTQIFDKTTSNGTLKMYVNGVENSEFENLVLIDDDEIKVEYVSN